MIPVLTAIALFIVFFLEARRPGSTGLILLPAFGTALLATIIAAGLAMIRWSRFRWLGLLPPLLLGVAFPGGQLAGFAARDREFMNTRLPVYLGIIGREVRTHEIPSFDQSPLELHLMPEELSVTKRASASRDANGDLVVRFYWAGAGPPPVHWTYDYIASDSPPQEEIPHRAYRRMAPHWYETRD